MSVTVIPGRYDQTTATGFSTGGRVQAAIADAASSTGVDFHYLYHQAKVESGLNPTAKAPTSSASGLYQFTSQTWLATVKQHGAEHGLGWAANAITRGANGHYYVADETTKGEILALRQNPETSARMAGEYASDNRDYLESRLGRQAGSVDLYMAHFLGPAGAARFLSARDGDGSRSAAAVMPTAAHANRWVFYNKDGSARSLDDVYARFAARFGTSGSDGTAAPSGTTPAASASAPAPALAAARAADTAAEIARMQLAALNGTGDAASLTTIGAGGATAAAGATATDASVDGAIAAKALLSPSPQTARLAYLMLSSLGV